MKLEDAGVREEAAFADANVAVTAGAGTGKTKLLIDAVLARALVRECELQKILLLTFTEKAAAEMRTRLEDLLRALQDPRTPEQKKERAAWAKRVGSPETLDARIEAAIQGLDRVEIGTIHGFCAHLLREYPIEAGIDPAFRIDERERGEEVFDREWGRWLDAELAVGGPGAAAWRRVLDRVSLAELRDVASGLGGFNLPEEALDPDLILAAGRAALKAVCKAESKKLIEIESKYSGRPTRLHDDIQAMAAFLDSPRAGAEIPDSAAKPGKGWGEHGDAAYRMLADVLPLCRDLAAVDEKLLKDVLGLLCPFARAYRKALVREGFVSFDGLLTRVRTLLLDEMFPEAREALKAKYRYILVDEFQDTDPVQCEIILLLSEAASSHARHASKVKLAAGKLFIVGDPKQSIYSFRGADIVAYERLKERIRSQDGIEPVLRTNFRSHSGIIGTVNTLFDRIIRRNADLQPPYERILSLKDRTPTLESQKIELLLVEGAENTEDARRGEAEAIASWVRGNVGKLRIPTPDGERPLKAGDVAVLLRSLTDVHLLLERLRDHRVSYVVEGEKHFFGAQEVIDFINLLRAVANPFDRIAMAGLLRSPLGAVEDADLLSLVKAKALDYRMEKPPAAVAELYAILRDLHAAAPRLTVPALVDEIFERTAVLELAALSAAGEQAVANLLKMRRTAEAFEASGASAATLRQFLKRMTRAVRELTEEGESALADEGLDAVRILSVHKSKGLEYPVVFLPDLHREPQSADEKGVKYDWPEGILGIRFETLITPGGALLRHLGKRRRLEEDRRLLYVAMTRARERLVLSGSAKYGGKSYLATISAAMVEAGGPDLGVADGLVETEELRIEVIRTPWREPSGFRKAKEAKADAPPDDWAALDASWNTRAREYASAAALSRFTSPTKLQERAAMLPASEEEEERRSRAADLGTLCHLVMERLDFAKPDFDGLVKSCAEELGAGDVTEARELLSKFARTAAFKEMKGAEILARELPFFRSHDGGVLQGVIDAVVRIDDRVSVIDYKTDREEKPGKYAEQKKWYLDAVRSVLGIQDADFRLLYLRRGAFVTV